MSARQVEPAIGKALPVVVDIRGPFDKVMGWLASLYTAGGGQ